MAGGEDNDDDPVAISTSRGVEDLRGDVRAIVELVEMKGVKGFVETAEFVDFDFNVRGDDEEP